MPLLSLIYRCRHTSQAQELYYALAAGLADDKEPPRYRPARAADGEGGGTGDSGEGVPTATPVANPFVDQAEEGDAFVGGGAGGAAAAVDVDVGAEDEAEYPPAAVPVALVAGEAAAEEVGDGKGTVAF